MTSPRVSTDIHYGRMALHSWIRSHRLSAISSGILAPPFAFTYCASVRLRLFPFIAPFPLHFSLFFRFSRFDEILRKFYKSPCTCVSISSRVIQRLSHVACPYLLVHGFSLDFFGIYFIPYLDVGNNAIIFFQIRTRGLVSEGEWSDSSQSRPRTLFRGLCM